MVLVPFALAAGLLLGLLRRGRLENLLGLKPARWTLFTLGLPLLLLGEYGNLPRWAALSAFIFGSVLLIIGLAKNTRFTGAITIAIGLLANLVALVANGHVPVRNDALVAAGEVDASGTALPATGLRNLTNESTSLEFLGEIVPVEILNAVVSFGDLIVAAGVIVFAMNLLLAHRRRGVGVDELLGPETRSLPQPELLTEPIDLRKPSRAPSPALDGDTIDVRPNSDIPVLRPAGGVGARVFGPDESGFTPPSTGR